MTPAERAAQVKLAALDLGFDSVGICDLAPSQHQSVLNQWLTAGMAGDMTYMQRQAGRRNDPASIVKGATRAVVVTRCYDHREPDDPPGARQGRVAKYARGIDYHHALRPALDSLSQAVKALGGDWTIARAYVDAGPVPERELAQRAGLGWIGKNTMLIDPRRGSYSFIAAVLTDLDLAVDAPFAADRCGTCTRCLDACPTAAFPAERVLDARRCISYLTIEHRGAIPPALAHMMNDWVFGCDVCQDVCPWNVRFATSTGEGLGLTPELARVDVQELAAMDDDAFAEHYGMTPFARPGPEGMRRNARIVAQNLD